MIRDFSAGNPLNNPDPTILNTAELDFRFSYAGAVAVTANAFLISNNPGFRHHTEAPLASKASTTARPLSLRIDVGNWNGGSGTFTPGTAEALGFTLTGPIGRLAGDTAKITSHDAAGAVLSTQVISSGSVANTGAYTSYSGTVSHAVN